MKMPTTIWTIGHSTRSSDELLAVLNTFEIECVVDVRRFPGSRRQPQFERTTLAERLAADHINYCWLPSLGGRRRPMPGSTNDGWLHPAFRAYADHVDTEEFAAGLFELLMLASELRTVVMCAEILWWRCHRRLIADVLVSLGYSVLHIRAEGTPDEHRLAPPARLIEGRLVYHASA